MKKGLTIALLVLIGMVAAAGLVIGEIIELAEAIIGFIVWALVILAIFLIIKIRF